MPPPDAQPLPALPQFEHISRYWDSEHQCFAARLMPGEYYVTRHAELISTVLGSCVSACIRESRLGMGQIPVLLPPMDPRQALGLGRQRRHALRQVWHGRPSMTSSDGRRPLHLSDQTGGRRAVLAEMTTTRRVQHRFRASLRAREGSRCSARFSRRSARACLYFPQTGRIRWQVVRAGTRACRAASGVACSVDPSRRRRSECVRVPWPNHDSRHRGTSGAQTAQELEQFTRLIGTRARRPFARLPSFPTWRCGLRHWVTGHPATMPWCACMPPSLAAAAELAIPRAHPGGQRHGAAPGHLRIGSSRAQRHTIAFAMSRCDARGLARAERRSASCGGRGASGFDSHAWPTTRGYPYQAMLAGMRPRGQVVRCSAREPATFFPFWWEPGTCAEIVRQWHPRGPRILTRW